MKPLRRCTPVVLICALCLTAIALARELNKPAIEVVTPYGKFILHNLTLKMNGFLSATLDGQITNETDRNWQMVAMTVVLRDGKGQLVALNGKGPELLVDSLAKGQSKPLSGMIFYDKQTKQISDFELRFAPDSSFFESRYVLSLVKPENSKEMRFQDDFIAITFNVITSQAEFTLQNKTNNPIRVLWDEASFIDFSGTSHRVIHKGTRLADRDKPQSPTTIPPTANVEELAYPADYVEWSTFLHDWSERSMLPSSQEALKAKGQTFSLFLPVEVNGEKKNYLFTFKIDDVQI